MSEEELIKDDDRDDAKTVKFDYDLLKQTTQILRLIGGGTTYTYDENGNRTSASGGGGSVQLGADNRVTFDGTFHYTYDGEGNVLSKTLAPEDYRSFAATFAYDLRNRLVSVQSAEQLLDDNGPTRTTTQQASYAYDSDDRRVAKDIERDIIDYTASDGCTYEGSDGCCDEGSDGCTYDESDGCAYEGSDGLHLRPE